MKVVILSQAMLCLLSLFLVALFSTSPSYSQVLTKPKIAVLRLTNQTKLKSDEILYLTNEIQAKLQIKLLNRYQILTQANISELLPDDIKPESCDENECEVSIGRNMGVDLILTGQVLHFGKQGHSLRLVLKLHETKHGNLLNAQTSKGLSQNDLEAQLSVMIDALVDQGLKALDILAKAQSTESNQVTPKQNTTQTLQLTTYQFSAFQSPQEEWTKLQAIVFLHRKQGIRLLEYFIKRHENFRVSSRIWVQQAEALLNKMKANEYLSTMAGINWIRIDGGEFIFRNATGAQEVIKVNPFYISQSEITIGQYQKCIQAGICNEPKSLGYCANVYPLEYARDELLDVEEDTHSQGTNKMPINCINWQQARQFAKWLGGDLPSAVQWEYAAIGQSKYDQLPWGNERPSCDFAVVQENHFGCGKNAIWRTCQKPKGNSKQGVCDMIGNVWEWLLDDQGINDNDWKATALPRCRNSNCEPENESDHKQIIGGSFKTFWSTADEGIKIRALLHREGFTDVGFRVILPSLIDQTSRLSEP